MKCISIFFFMIPFLIYGQNKFNTIDLSFYGQKIDLKNIQNFKENKIDFLENRNESIKIEGEILSTCPMKGCWMKIEVDRDTLLVRFKNYGFFVPKFGSEGKSAVINGLISKDTISVAQLRHYAEDAGKSSYEISQIKKPELTLSFLADGVIIKN